MASTVAAVVEVHGDRQGIAVDAVMPVAVVVGSVEMRVLQSCRRQRGGGMLGNGILRPFVSTGRSAGRKRLHIVALCVLI